MSRRRVKITDDPTPIQTLWDWLDLMRMTDNVERADWEEYCSRCLNEVMIRERLLNPNMSIETS